MLVTNDGLQENWAVACAKFYIYKQCLPNHINKVIFVADGARNYIVPYKDFGNIGQE